MPAIYDTLRADIVLAMKARDAATATALRTMDAAIQRASMDLGKPIDDALSTATLRKAVKNLSDAKAEFEKGGRTDLVAANGPQTAGRRLEEILSAEEHLARRRSELRVVEPHHREAGDALARPRLADDAEYLARLDREADPVDGLHDAVVRLELGPQIADVQEGLAHRAKLT